MGCGRRAGRPSAGFRRYPAADVSPGPGGRNIPVISVASAREYCECGGPKAGARDRPPELAVEPGARDAKPRELRQHLDEVRAADELDLVPHPPPRRESVTLLAGVEAGPQPLLRPPERLERSARVAHGVLDVDVTRAGGPVQAGIVQERGAQQQLTVKCDAARVGEALRDQILTHGVALHVAVGLPGRDPQRSSAAASASVHNSSSARRRVSPRMSCHVSGRRRPGPPARTCHPGLSARSARHTRPPYSTVRRYLRLRVCGAMGVDPWCDSEPTTPPNTSPRLRREGDLGGHADDDAERQAQHRSERDRGSDAHTRESMGGVSARGDLPRHGPLVLSVEGVGQSSCCLRGC